jgi:hypothetical protein
MNHCEWILIELSGGAEAEPPDSWSESNGKPEAYRYVLRQRRNSSQNILGLQRDDRREYQPKEHE